MKMDDGEIIREYKAGLNRNNMVSVLADRNCVSRKEMAQWLIDHGQEVDRRILSGHPPRRKPKKPDTAAIIEIPEGEEITPPDQTAKADAGKPRLSLVPMQIMFDVAQIREYGNKKYPEGGPDNWKRVEPDRFIDALLRHLLRFVQDRNSVDEESGFSHLSHAACNLAFLCEIYHGGK